MKIESIVISMAGVIVLVSIALAFYVSQTWLLLTAFVGLNLLVSGLTGFCPMAYVLRKLGFEHGSLLKKIQ